MPRSSTIVILALLALPLVATAGPPQAQSSTTSAQHKPVSVFDLESIRQSGYEGSIDPSELWQRSNGPQDDEFLVSPAEEAVTSGDENWWDGFGGTAIEYEVACAAIFQGSLVIGGSFNNAGGVPGTANIARWDGNKWCPMESKISASDDVSSLAVFQGELYVSGSFSPVGNGPISKYLIRWDGSVWRSAGGAPNDNIYSLVVINSLLYAGGDFTVIGGIAANRIASWNGISWSAMGSGTNDLVLAIVSFEGNITIGGDFTQSGATPLGRVASWTGSSWQPLGTGLNDVVNSLTASDSILVAGGYFLLAGTVPANRVARWDGTQWSALGSGLNSDVNAVRFVGSDLWAGGYFTTAGGVSAKGLARWNGSTWSPFGIGVWPETGNGRVTSISVLGDSVYVGGYFQHADNMEAINFAGWHAGAWFAPMASTGNGTTQSVYDFAQYLGDIYVAGTFHRAGGQVINRLARWDGSTWSPAGNPSFGAYSLTVYNDRLIVGGEFVTIGGVSASRIAQWDGISWQPLGSGMNSSVLALSVINGELYAGGFFTTAGGVSANRVARWDGTTWHALGTGLTGGSSPAIWGLEEFDGSVYVGGKFTTAGSVTTKGLARWDGVNWYAVGGGVQGVDNGGNSYEPTVYDFAHYGGKLIVGGDFTRTNGQISKYAASWDGASWGALGVGAGGRVFALSTYGPDLVAAGWVAPGGSSGPLQFIAKWDGLNWLALGSGLNSIVNTLSVIGNDLYVGGVFQTAGGKSSLAVARWTDITVSSVPKAPKPSLTLPYPNPFQGAVTVQYEATVKGSYRLDVFDLQGRRVRALDRGEYEAGSRQVSWDGLDDQARDTQPGVYFLRVEGPAGTESFKVVRQR